MYIDLFRSFRDDRYERLISMTPAKSADRLWKLEMYTNLESSFFREVSTVN